MKKSQTSAGLLMFRNRREGLEVFLVHPGGPYWRKKNLGAWTIPKGEVAEGEDLRQAAIREFAEETGITPAGPFIDLGEAKQAGGKTVKAWAFEKDCAPSIQSNTFSIEWPPRSGRVQEFPEVDRGEWFSVEDAQKHINSGQIMLLLRLQNALNES